MTAHETSPVVIVCALEFERNRLMRAGLADEFEMHVCGPGANGISAWAEAQRDGTTPIVLAGLAGGLTERMSVGSACVVTGVRAANGETLTPTFTSLDARLPGATVSCPPRSITSPGGKRIWREEHKTDLVDLESEAFARAMNDAGRPWAIVRGISDGPLDQLPATIDDWVNDRGQTRRSVVALTVLKNPAMLSAVRRLGTQAKQAMGSVAEALRSLAPAT